VSESKIKKTMLSFPVTFEKVEEVESADGRFTKVKIWLMHTGKNLNNSIFEKSVVDKAIPTLEYIPIVGFIETNSDNEKDFSDHRYIITKDEFGVRRKYIGNSYGVIKSSIDNNAHYETRFCDDGETREFLVVDGILWNMFEDSSMIMNQDIVKSQSMELYEKNIQGYEDDDGIFHFTDFSFRAACILGNNVVPAMTGSTIEVQFSMNDFVESIQSELNDKYTAFTKIINAGQNFTKSNEMVNDNNKGGIENMPNTDFSTVLQQFKDISDTIAQHETMKDRWDYEYPRYNVVDVQENEVIVVDRMNNYNYFAFPFTLNGDSVEINFESCKRKKISYEDYEEGAVAPEGAFDFGKHIANIEEAAFAKVNDANVKVEDAELAKSEAEANYTAIKADYDEIKPKYDAYVQADEQRQAEELNAQKDAKFAEYEDVLSENADFVTLKERKTELSVDEIEKECAVLYVKVNRAKNNFSKTQSTSTTVGVPTDDNDADDDYIDTKYGRIRKVR
jgi:hypothetical protein